MRELHHQNYQGKLDSKRLGHLYSNLDFLQGEWLQDPYLKSQEVADGIADGNAKRWGGVGRS